MAPLNWQESSDTPAPASRAGATAQWSPGMLGFFVGAMGGAAFSLGLVGIVVGYSIGSGSGFSFGAGAVPTQVAQAPTPVPSQAPAPEPTSSDNLPAIDAKTDHIRGDLRKATVAVVEYSDFECPFCKRHHPTMQQIMDTYKDDVVWVYRHFPLSFHPNAQKAAEASECANELGGNDAFWKFTDGVFALDALSTEGFSTVAKGIGLSESKFKQCLDSGKYAKHVQNEMDAGAAAGVQGTPGNFIVNLKTDENRIVSGAQPFSSFKTVIDELLGSDVQAAAPKGTAKIIKMTAELWKFTPNVVRVKKGEQVTLEITGVSGTHGLSVPGLGLSETIIQGNTVSVTIPTDKAGTFDFACSIQCGSGHNDMTGQIIIET